MIRSAASSSADVVILDLEDSVTPSEKIAARAKVVKGLVNLTWDAKTTAVRINPVDSHFSYEDLIQVVEGAGDALDIVVIPKVKSARDVWFVDTLLTHLEVKHHRTKPVGLEVIIEDVEALINVEDIVRCSPRLEAVTFGPGDFSASQGMTSYPSSSPDAYPVPSSLYALNKIVIAGRAAGIDAIDGPFASFEDLEGLRAECIGSAGLGFVGKWAIHPTQIEIANETYSPSQSEVERARKIMEEYDRAGAQGLGAVSLDGSLLDAALVRRLQGTIERADLIGM